MNLGVTNVDDLWRENQRLAAELAVAKKALLIAQQTSIKHALAWNARTAELEALVETELVNRFKCIDCGRRWCAVTEDHKE